MIPKYRAFVKKENKLFETDDLLLIDFLNEEVMLQQNSIIYATSFDFDEVVLMQSTGLKDKNGKEIFEGDIVRMRNPRDRRQIGMFQVVRVANSPMLGLLDKKLTTEIFNLYEHMRNYYEIIGNIYENPELLEVK